MRLVTILNKTLKFKSFGFEKSKFGKKIKEQGQGQRQQTIEIEIERSKRLHQLITTLQHYNITTYNQGNKVILGMEG